MIHNTDNYLLELSSDSKHVLYNTSNIGDKIACTICDMLPFYKIQAQNPYFIALFSIAHHSVSSILQSFQVSKI